MPNNIKNVLRVEGEPAEVARFFAAIHGGHDENGNEIVMDFNKIIPMPPSLAIEHSSRTTQGLEMYSAFKLENLELSFLGGVLGTMDSPKYRESATALTEKYAEMQAEFPEAWGLGKQAFENLAQHGAPTWYEWCQQNWGTKWNAYGQERCGDEEISFQTQDGGVRKLMERLIEQYPDLRFEYRHASEIFGYSVLHVEFEHGKFVCGNRPTDGSHEAGVLAAQIWNLDLSTEMEMEQS